MPELPEAETIARGLRPHLPGRRILQIEVLRPDVIVGSAEAFVASLSGTRVEGVGRRGKNLVLEISAVCILDSPNGVFEASFVLKVNYTIIIGEHFPHQDVS